MLSVLLYFTTNLREKIPFRSMILADYSKRFHNNNVDVKIYLHDILLVLNRSFLDNFSFSLDHFKFDRIGFVRGK
jgi:hypothetical protein